MMSFTDEEPLRAILRDFTYRPDWHFSIEDKTLMVRAIVIDTDDLTKKIPLCFGIELPSFMRPDFDWAHWLFDQIMVIERHEAQEFFKIKGVKVFDPHG